MLTALVSNVLGYSDAINQTLSDFNNFTRADNFLEITQEANAWLGYSFGIVLLIVLAIVYFGTALLFVNQFSKASLFTSLMLTITAILFKAINIVSDLAVYFCLIMLIVTLGANIIGRRGE